MIAMHGLLASILVTLALGACLVLGQNTGATVAWANSECDTNSQWLCAEFVARSLAAGGFITGTTLLQLLPSELLMRARSVCH